MLEYLSTTWMVHKERFIAAWTNQYAHFGNVNTSQAEGQHGVLKRYLGASTKDLRDVQIRLSQAFTNQIHEIQAQVSSERI